jgi:hypothetical protein
MAVTAISLTGWDNTVEPAAAVEFMASNPEAIMGIHFSQERRGSSRHPNKAWVIDFVRLARQQSADVMGHGRADAHLGNRWSLEVASGKMGVLDEEVDPAVFRRVQLNHLGRAKPEEFLVGAEKRSDLTFVLSRSGATKSFCEPLDDILKTYQGPAKVAFLYDDSWGQGRTPEDWPKVLTHAPCGYAGGLGPENLSEQIQKLLALNPDAQFWVDMESRLRNERDIFDIGYAQKCVDIAREHIVSSGFRL